MRCGAITLLGLLVLVEEEERRTRGGIFLGVMMWGGIVAPFMLVLETCMIALDVVLGDT